MFLFQSLLHIGKCTLFRRSCQYILHLLCDSHKEKIIMRAISSEEKKKKNLCKKQKRNTTCPSELNNITYIPCFFLTTDPFDAIVFRNNRDEPFAKYPILRDDSAEYSLLLKKGCVYSRKVRKGFGNTLENIRLCLNM